MLRDLLTVFSALFCAGAAAGCLYLVYAGFAVRRFACSPQPRGGALAPVSVLKPLCGDDPQLYRNLVSFCRQDHPSWQMIFGVQDANDPALPVLRRVMAELPEADLALVIDGRAACGNFKVANLQNMLPSARHDLIVIADSDMRVTQDYLAAVTGPLGDPAVGLVTCLYRALPAGGFWSLLAALHINHGFLPQAVVAARLGKQNGCFGATIALRRSTLSAVGGFAAIADKLADDHALGAAVRRRGLKVVLSPYIVDNVVVEPSLAALFRHELRWARTIRAIAPLGFVGSIVTQPMILALAALVCGAFPVTAALLLAAALASRAVMVRLCDEALRLSPTPLWLVPLRDLLSLAVFAASFMSRSVAWRDRTFRIGRHGQLIAQRR